MFIKRISLSLKQSIFIGKPIIVLISLAGALITFPPLGEGKVRESTQLVMVFITYNLTLRFFVQHI